MPALLTHSKLLYDSIRYLKRKKDCTPCTRSLDTIFKTPNFMRAAYFGALGPDIFEYLPVSRHNNHYGLHLTRYLHSEGLRVSLSSMLKRSILSHDSHMEWTTIQRSYLYGYLSHLIADSIFHPFVFYWAGFPQDGSSPDTYHHREQYLLFEYNMDLFFQYHHEKGYADFDINNALPLKRLSRGPIILDPAVKTFLLETISEIYPQLSKKRLLSSLIGIGQSPYHFRALDLLPFIIKYFYTAKRNDSRRPHSLVSFLRRKGIFSPDCLLRYPSPKRMNRHVLNLHRERWFYPAGAGGLHYESVEDLYKTARDKIVETWERIEAHVYERSGDFSPILDDLSIDAYTGERAKTPETMRISNPVRLRF